MTNFKIQIYFAYYLKRILPSSSVVTTKTFTTKIVGHFEIYIRLFFYFVLFSPYFVSLHVYDLLTLLFFTVITSFGQNNYHYFFNPLWCTSKCGNWRRATRRSQWSPWLWPRWNWWGTCRWSRSCRWCTYSTPAWQSINRNRRRRKVQ